MLRSQGAAVPRGAPAWARREAALRARARARCSSAAASAETFDQEDYPGDQVQ